MQPSAVQGIAAGDKQEAGGRWDSMPGRRLPGPHPPRRTCSDGTLAASLAYCGRLASFSSDDSAFTAPGGRSRPAPGGRGTLSGE